MKKPSGRSRLGKRDRERQAEFFEAGLSEESGQERTPTSSNRFNALFDRRRRSGTSRSRQATATRPGSSKRRRTNSQSSSASLLRASDTDGSTDRSVSYRRSRLNNNLEFDTIMQGARFEFESSDEEEDDPPTASRYDQDVFPTAVPVLAPAEKYESPDAEEASYYSGYETDDEVEDVATTFDKDDSDDDSPTAAFEMQFEQPVPDLLDPDYAFADTEVDDDLGAENQTTTTQETPDSAHIPPTLPGNVTDKTNNSEAPAPDWTPDLDRLPRHGERIVCPKWGHPLLRNRQTVQDEDAGKKSTVYRKVAKFFAAGRMQGEQPTQRDEEKAGTLRRHHLVSTDEPPELCASDDSDDPDREPVDSQYLLSPPAPFDHAPPAWKALSSAQMRSGANPMSGNQYDALYHLWEEVTQAQLKEIKDVLFDHALDEPELGEGTPQAKYRQIEDALRSKIPIYSLRRVKDLKTQVLSLYKSPVFRFQCFNLEDPKEKPSLSSARLLSDIISSDLLTPGLCQMILYPTRCNTFGVLPHYYDTDHGRDTAACHRPGAYGVAADACEGKAAKCKKTDIPRPYTNLLFCQGSTLRLSLKSGFSARLPKSYTSGRSNPRLFNRIKQKDIICRPQWEPFIVRKDLQASEMAKDGNDHHPRALNKLARAGSICWHVTLEGADQQEVAQQLYNGRDLVKKTRGSDFLESMMDHFNVYLCYSMLLDEKEEETAEVDDENSADGSESSQDEQDTIKPPPLYQKSVIFIRKNQKRKKRTRLQDKIIGVNTITVLDTPEGWVKGSLRPVETEPVPNPYTTKLYDHDNDGIEIATLPFRPFLDDCALSADGKKTGGGLYGEYPGMGQRLKTAVQSIRIAGFVTDKTETDAMLLALAHDIAILQNQGMIMETAVGKRRIYVDIPCLSGDWVQCAKSTHATGHASNAPCGGCTWRRGPDGTVRYCAAKGMSDLNFFMNMDRCEAVLDMGLKAKQLSHIGVRQNALIDIQSFYDENVRGVHAFNVKRSKKAPLHALRVVRECTPSIVRYDPFLSCWPGPDHLLFLGLGKGILNLQLSVLSISDRKKYVAHLKNAISEAGLTEPYGLLRKNQNLEKGFVAGLSVAQVAACVLCSPVALSQFNNQIYSTFEGASALKKASMRDLRIVRGLMVELRRIIALIYFAPRTVSDTKESALRRVRATRQLGDLVALYMRHVESIATDPALNPELRQRVIKFCDLPNLHRLFEVCTFWLPSVNYNIAYMAEIMFEKCHQVVKMYFKFVPNHPEGGYFFMDRLLSDESMKRMRIGSSSSVEPGGSIFDYRASEGDWRLVDQTTCFFAPGHHGSDPPLASLADFRTDRIWRKRSGLQTSGLQLDEMKSMCKAMRIPLSCELSQIKEAKFGNGRQSHNVLKTGSILSAITDSEAKANMSINRPNDLRLRLRSCLLSEELHTQNFGKCQVIVLVKELWEARYIDSDSTALVSIFAKGIILQTAGTVSKEDLPVYKASEKQCYVKLDKSCKKVMAFPWQPIGRALTGRPFLGMASIQMDLGSFLEQDYYVIVDHEHGYPSRAG